MPSSSQPDAVSVTAAGTDPEHHTASLTEIKGGGTPDSQHSSVTTSTSVTQMKPEVDADGSAKKLAVTNEAFEPSGNVTVSPQQTRKPIAPPSNNDVIRSVLDGACPLGQLPALAKKCVRIFISSTFSDSKAERNALMERVYPKLTDFCRDNYGIEFQVVDMRWGVPEHASDDHSTTELCIQEIIKCQQVSAGPNFVALLGNRYGYRPVPTVIKADEFQILKAAVATSSAVNWNLVSEWYLLDENSLNPVYILQPVSVKLRHQRNAKKLMSEWNRIEDELSSVLRQAAKQAHNKRQLTDSQMHQFFMSVTENEITHGIMESSVDPASTTLCIIRNIKDIKSHLGQNPRTSRFMDVVNSSPGSQPDSDAESLLTDLREVKVKSRLPPDNLTRYELDWQSVVIDETSTAPSSAVIRHREYIDSFCSHFYESVSKLVAAGCSGNRWLAGKVTAVVKNGQEAAAAETGAASMEPNKTGNNSSSRSTVTDPALSEIADVDEGTLDEVLQHLHFARTRCELFQGRQDSMEAVRQYLAGPSRQPMVVYGPSGCGKTSILAKTVDNLAEWAAAAARNRENTVTVDPTGKGDGKTNVRKRKRIVTIIRFLGTTPRSCNVRDLLSSLCRHLIAVYGMSSAEKVLNNDKLNVGGKTSGQKRADDMTSVGNGQSRTRSVVWQEPDKLTDLVASFHQLLTCANSERPLLLILDSIDQLSSVYDAYRVTWLPVRLPPHVKLIVSTLVEGYDVLENLRQRFPPPPRLTPKPPPVAKSTPAVPASVSDNSVETLNSSNVASESLPSTAADSVSVVAQAPTPVSSSASTATAAAAAASGESGPGHVNSVDKSSRRSNLVPHPPTAPPPAHVSSVDASSPQRSNFVPHPPTAPPPAQYSKSRMSRIRRATRPADHATYLEVGPLGQSAGLEVVVRWLEASGRCITARQRQAVMAALEQCSYPLYARLAFNQVRQWHSYDDVGTVTSMALRPTVREAIERLYEKMEEKFGRPIVRHSLSYLTSARHGLSETELEHIMSLDDDLLNQVYTLWMPPLRRIPPLLWTRLRADLSSYLVERSADGQQVLAWYHRQFAEAARRRYLDETDQTTAPIDIGSGSDQQDDGVGFAARTHGLLVEFFSGRWGGGRLKPFRYLPAQVARFNLNRADSEADRKVPLQPYRIDGVGGGGSTSGRVWYNRRRLSELPWHILYSHQKQFPASDRSRAAILCRQQVIEVMKKQVFFDFEWLYSKLKTGAAGSSAGSTSGGSGQGLVDEIEYLTQLDSSGGLSRDPEVRILLANLRLIRPYLDKFPESLHVELVGRLGRYVGNKQYPSIDRLIAGCDVHGPRLCAVTPVLTCFDSADLGLKANVAVRTTELWHSGGAIVCNRAMTSCYVIDYDELTSQPTLSVWNIETGDRVSSTPLVSGRAASDKSGTADPTASLIDVYIDARLIGNNEDHLLVMYIPYQRGMVRNHGNRLVAKEGYADVIRLSDVKVIRTIQEFLAGQPFKNSLLYMTKNWIAIRYGWGVPLFHLWNDKKVGLTKPHALTPDETKFVLVRSKKVGVKSYHGDEKVVAYSSWTKTSSLRNFVDKSELGEFDKSESFSGVTLSGDGTVALLADCYGNINVYDIGPTVNLGPGKVLRVRRSLALPSSEKIRVFDLDMNDKERQTVRQNLIVSPSSSTPEGDTSATSQPTGDSAEVCYMYVIGCYKGVSSWEAFLWSLSFTSNKKVFNSRFVSRLCHPRRLDDIQPQFNYDGRLIVDLVGTSSDTIRLISSRSGLPVRIYRIGQTVRSLHVSPGRPEMGVLAGKDLMIFEVGGDSIDISEESESSNETDATNSVSDAVGDETELLPAEHVTHMKVNPRVVLRTDAETGEISAVEVPQGGSSSGTQRDEDNTALDRLTSARCGNSSGSRSRLAASTWSSPDNSKVVELLVRIQVVDFTKEEIVYSPKSTDKIQRPTATAASSTAEQQQQQQHDSEEQTSVAFQTVAWPKLNMVESATGAISQELVTLVDGDRIVNESNKIRLRVTSSMVASGNLRVVWCPSALVISGRDPNSGQLGRLYRIHVYQESIVTISNRYLVTCSLKRLGSFVNVYDLSTGRVLSTHACSGSSPVARLSADDRWLYVTGSNLVVNHYAGPDFVVNQTSTGVPSVTPSVKARNYVVRDLLTSLFEHDVVVLRYQKSSALSGAACYVHCNLATGRRGKPVTAASGAGLEDVSRDLRVGVDDRLTLYDMPSGTVLLVIPYWDSTVSGSRIQVRLSDDARYAVFVDRQDDTLHVVRLGVDVSSTNVANSCRFIASCCVHTPSALITLRSAGRVICARNSDSARISFLLAIQDCNDAEFQIGGGIGHVISQQDYRSEWNRAVAIATRCQQALSQERRPKALEQTTHVNVAADGNSSLPIKAVEST